MVLGEDVTLEMHGEWNGDTSKKSRTLFCVCTFSAQVQTMPLTRSQGSTFITIAEQIPPCAFSQALHAFELHLRKVASMIQKLPSISLHALPALSLKCCKVREKVSHCAIGSDSVLGRGCGAYVPKMPMPLLSNLEHIHCRICFNHV